MWQLDSHLGQLSVGSWHASTNLGELESGLRFTNKELGEISSGAAFMIRPNDGKQRRLAEAYTRTHDLVAKLEETAADQFAYEVYFRQVDSRSPIPVAIECWVSIQTQLLDSQPSIEVGFAWPELRWTHWDADREGNLLQPPVGIKQFEDSAVAAKPHPGARQPAMILAHQVDGPVLAAILIHPWDQAQTSTRIDATNKIPCRLQLFSEFMEKGVIRRARLRLLLPTAKATVSHFQDAYEAFAKSDLPLTT